MQRILPGLVSLLLIASACSGSSPDVATGTDSEATTSQPTAGQTDAPTTDEVAVVDPGGEDPGSMGEEEEATTAAPTTEAPDVSERETTTTTIEIPAGVSDDVAADLGAAAGAGNELRFAGPYIYLTIEQSCDGCAEAASLYFVPRPAPNATLHELSAVVVDGVEGTAGQVIPLLQTADPLHLAEDLLAAVSAGDDVTYGVDPASGLVTTWSINGDSARILCLQVDTRPREMRDLACSGSLTG